MLSETLEKNLKNNLNQEEMKIAARRYGITFSEIEDKVRKFAKEHPIYETFWFMPVPFKAIVNPESFYHCLKCGRVHTRNSKIGKRHLVFEHLTPDEESRLSNIAYHLKWALEEMGYAYKTALYILREIVNTITVKELTKEEKNQS